MSLSYVPVPLGNFVFENAMVPECVPRQTAALTMILMCVVTTMRENDIRVNALFQELEPRFHLLTLLCPKSVMKWHYLNFGAGRVREKVGRGSPCFTLAQTCAAK